MKNFLKATTIGCTLLALFAGQNKVAFASSISEDNLVITDGYTVEQIVEQTLGKGNYTYEKLSSFSDPDRFILVEGDNCYLIYDNQLKDFLEFSTECNSVYYDLDKSVEKVYYSPTYYFYKSKDSICDIHEQNVLSKSEISDFISSEAVLLDSYLQQKKIKAETLQVSPNPPIPVRITNDFYFRNLDVNFGSNTGKLFTGSCGYVALEMVLSYYDNIRNDNVISENFDIGSYHTFTDLDSIHIGSYTSSPGVDNNFHSYLINLGKGLALTEQNENSISINGMSTLMNYYFNNIIGLRHTGYGTGLFTNVPDFCRSAIAYDSPVIIQIKGIDATVDNRELNHAVVGYEYDSNGIYVHFGWKSTYRDYTHICISNYTLADAYYFNINAENHVCSNNYIFNLNGCTGNVCACSSIICNHEVKSFVNISYDSHKANCSGCGKETFLSHNYLISGNNKICSDCGRETHLTHNYTYTPIFGGKYHWARCRCGYENREPCMGFASAFDPTVKCNKCGQTVTSGFKMEDENQPSFIIK